MAQCQLLGLRPCTTGMMHLTQLLALDRQRLEPEPVELEPELVEPVELEPVELLVVLQ